MEKHYQGRLETISTMAIQGRKVANFKWNNEVIFSYLYF